MHAARRDARFWYETAHPAHALFHGGAFADRPASRRGFFYALLYIALRGCLSRALTELRGKSLAHDPGAVVLGGLVENVEFTEGLGPVLGFGAHAVHFETVETGTEHEQELVAQHLAGGAQRALVAQPRAQQPRLGIGPSVIEARKFQRDQGETMHLAVERDGVRGVGQTQAQLGVAALERVVIPFPARE